MATLQSTHTHTQVCVMHQSLFWWLTLNRYGRSTPKRLSTWSPRLAGFSWIHSFSVFSGCADSVAGPLGCVPILQVALSSHCVSQCHNEAYDNGERALLASEDSDAHHPTLRCCMYIAEGGKTHQSSAKGLDSSMAAPLSPASLATCKLKSCQLLPQTPEQEKKNERREPSSLINPPHSDPLAFPKHSFEQAPAVRAC